MMLNYSKLYLESISSHSELFLWRGDTLYFGLTLDTFNLSLWINKTKYLIFLQSRLRHEIYVRKMKLVVLMKNQVGSRVISV